MSAFGVLLGLHFGSVLAPEVDLGGLPPRKGRLAILNIPLNENEGIGPRRGSPGAAELPPGSAFEIRCGFVSILDAERF